MSDNQGKAHKEFEDTSSFPAMGFDGKIPTVSGEEIRQSETAFNILLHQVQETDRIYSETVQEVGKLNAKLADAQKTIAKLDKKSSDRFSAVIISSVAEVVIAIGVGIISICEKQIVPTAVIGAGVIMTTLSLWLNFKPMKDVPGATEEQSKS